MHAYLRGVSVIGPVVGSALVVAVVLSLGATPALAGVALSVAPNFPPAVKVGQTGSGTLTITNKNDGANLAHSDRITATNDAGTVTGTVTLVPSCGSSANAQHCAPVSADPGVFTLSAAATGAAGSSCAGDTFTVAIDDVTTGEYMFTRVGGDLSIPGNAGFCTITFDFAVSANPTKDSVPIVSGVQTSPHAGADALDEVDMFTTGGGIGSTSVSFPGISTTTNPSSGTVGVTTLNDSASVVGIVPDPVSAANPTGTVTFSLFDPSDQTCAGGAAFTNEVNLTACTYSVAAGAACSTSAGFLANQAGTWHWRAQYSGDANNPSVTSVCANEPVVIAKVTPTLNTTPNPASGTALVTALNDSAQLSGGLSPFSGTITFNLFSPSQPGCGGSPFFTQAVAVSPGGSASTSGGPVANATGTWQWTASYGGDANNNPATSGCTVEPVTIGQPALTIQKTPDGTTYAAGDTISFTIVVTNVGPGTAVNVHFSPLDNLPDPNASLQWGPPNPVPVCAGQSGAATCSVSGAAGSQVLSCSFGDLAVGGNCTVTVTSPTQTQNVDPGDCGTGTPLVLQNTATAVADNTGSVFDSGFQSCLNVPPPVIRTTPNPGTGTLGTVLNDSATLTGGVNLTGVITFQLFDPNDPNCSVGVGGNPRYIDTVPVNGAGTYSTSPGFAADIVGTWRWSASYSGDNANPPVSSDCAELVTITGPVIPTLSEWGMVVMVALLMGTAFVTLRRRSRA